MNPIDLRVDDSDKKGRVFWMSSQYDKTDQCTYNRTKHMHPEQSWSIDDYGSVLGEIDYTRLSCLMINQYCAQINTFNNTHFLSFMCDQVLSQHKEKRLVGRPRRRVRRTLRKAKRK